MNKELPRICTPTDSYTRHYPRIIELTNQQFDKQFWTNTEMKVKLDRMQLLYGMEHEQSFAVNYILKTFLRYELIVGDFWRVVAETFPRPEVKAACSGMEAIERVVHAEFYNQINVVLGLDKDEDYLAYKEDPLLLERVNWLNSVLESEDKILATTIFSMTETALLFSLFVLLKSFQNNGYNMIPVTVRGTNQSAIDEDLHGQISAEIINTYYNEIGSSLYEDKVRYPKVVEAIKYAYEHECQLIRNAIPSGKLNGVTEESYIKFVQLRFDVYCDRLNIPRVFDVQDCEIADWFEKNTYAYKVIDFFTPGMGQEYETAWDNDGLVSAWTKG